jgi:hypothetical protein
MQIIKSQRGVGTIDVIMMSLISVLVYTTVFLPVIDVFIDIGFNTLDNSNNISQVATTKALLALIPLVVFVMILWGVVSHFRSGREQVE